MKPGRNDPCHCGSGKKYKKCCEAKDAAKERESAKEVVPSTESEADAEEEPAEGGEPAARGVGHKAARPAPAGGNAPKPKPPLPKGRPGVRRRAI